MKMTNRLLLGIISLGDRLSKKAKGVNECFKVECKDHDVDFNSHKNINSAAYLNQVCLHSKQLRGVYDGKQFFYFC